MDENLTCAAQSENAAVAPADATATDDNDGIKIFRRQDVVQLNAVANASITAAGGAILRYKSQRGLQAQIFARGDDQNARHPHADPLDAGRLKYREIHRS